MEVIVDSDLVVFYKPRCPFAAKLRLKLRLNRMPFRSVRFGVDPESDAAVRAANSGNEVSPTVRVGDRYLGNPTLGQIRAMHTSPVA
jgi:glutaredoxin